MKRCRIGKNPRGWFLALPRWWGGYDVIEELDSFEEAWAVLDHTIIQYRYGVS